MPHDPAYLSTAIRAALAAGRIHRRFFRQNPDVRKKGPIDLVTEADLEVEREFRRLIAEEWPGHAVLGEEQAAEAAAPGGCRWIIDPLDGTTNFAHGLALFCVSIALEIDGRIDIGVVYDPMGEELFAAERGLGARLNGRPICVSTTGTLVDALLCTGFPYGVRSEPGSQVDVFGGFLGHAQAVRRLGSAALDLCYVAAGRFDGFWEYRLQPWDIAAGALILEEAGGRLSRYDGSPIDLFGGQVVASNGRLHAAMCDVIARHHR